MPGLVHVSGYQQRRHGLLVDVADHDRGARADGGEKLSPEKAYRGYLDFIKQAEGSKGKPYGGARERHPVTNALGAFQMKPNALQDIGWKDPDGRWTGLARRNGVTSDEAFLRNASAQDLAMRAYTLRNHEQLAANGAMAHLGREYVSPKGGRFVVTEAGLAAAAHRAGANRTKQALEKLASRKAGNSPEFSPEELAAVTRLRTFEKVSYAKPRMPDVKP